MTTDTPDHDPSRDPTVQVTRAPDQSMEPKKVGRRGWFKRLFSRTPEPSREGGAKLADMLSEAVPAHRHVRADRIGEGGMATVEVLLDRALRRKTAMKLLLPKMEHEVQAVQSFIREAQVTGQLDHPNIVPVYDLGKTDDDRLFFTMKLLEGWTLTEVVQRLPEGPLERGQLLDLLEIVLRVCDALAFAHKCGVVHRDVKPENVMIGDFSQVYLVDWGLARLTSSEDEKEKERKRRFASSSFRRIWGTRVIGTPGYMSPEQAAGGEVDTRADIFAVGAMLYFLLARRPPFDGASTEKVLLRAQRCQFPPLQDVPGVPRELDRIIQRAMAQWPEDRYQSVVDLRQAIVTFMRGGSLPRVTFEPGHEIIREGDVGDHAYIIISGRCEVLKKIDGERVSLRTIAAGECFGETAIMTAEPRTASVVTLEETVVERINREELLEELDAIKPWVSVFLRSLAERFQERETSGR